MEGGGAVVAALLPPLPLGATTSSASIHIDATQITSCLPDLAIGVNLEDLNYQTYGGLYSQLLYAESFQEHLDSSVLGLTGKDRLQVFVEESPAGELQIAGWDGHRWTYNLARQLLGLPKKDDAIPVAVRELSSVQKDALESAMNGKQVSRHWTAFHSGSAEAEFRFERSQPFLRKQSQRFEFLSGTGEVGIDNAGLNRWGIHLVAGQIYEGVLRARADAAMHLHLSLTTATADGSRTLARTSVRVGPSTEYQRIEFKLTPSANDDHGHFRISLQEPGAITIGYAFLQPGAWGCYEGLPIRPDLVHGMLGQGIKVVRYNGSMVNRCPEPEFYKWKQMLGPADLRKPFRGTFNPYSSNGFGIFDFLNVAEKMGVTPIPGVRSDETPQDMADFIEYVNGPADSTWGKRRAADGHLAPYNLRHLEIGNEEQRMIAQYCARFQGIAKAIWDRDPKMVLLISLNLRSPEGQDLWSIGLAGELSQELQSVAQLLRFAQDAGHQIWIDNHTLANNTETAGEKNTSISSMGLLKKSMAHLVPGYNLGFATLEENGTGHDMERGLAHACNAHAIARMGSDMRAIAVANALQAWQQELTWSQGNTFFTDTEIWFQPGYYIDQMMSRNWAANVTVATLDGAHESLDVLAKLSEDRHTLILQVVNTGATSVTTNVALNGFHPAHANAKVTEIAADPMDENTLDRPKRIAPQGKLWNHALAHRADTYSFPPHSFTLIALT